MTNQEDSNRTLTTYVGDMHAWEEHILEPFERQLELTKGTPEAQVVVQQLVTTTRQHITALEQRVKTLGHTGKNITDALKTGVSELLGVAAATINSVRPQTVSKALRDDYTATNHAIIGYIMLQTTALALHDETTAELAASHLADHVKNAQAIAAIMPALVIKDVADDAPVDASIAKQVIGNTNVGSLYGLI